MDVAGLVAENAALQQQLSNLRSDFDLLRQDLEAVKQRLFMNEPTAFGSMPSINGGLLHDLPLRENGHHTSPQAPPPANPQSSFHGASRAAPQVQHRFGAFGLPFESGHPSSEGMVVIGGHDGEWLSSCHTFTPGEAACACAGQRPGAGSESHVPGLLAEK